MWPTKKVFLCYFGRRWVPFLLIFSGVCSDFQGFCEGFLRFCPDFHGFSPDSYQIKTVRSHPRLLYQWCSIKSECCDIWWKWNQIWFPKWTEIVHFTHFHTFPKIPKKSLNPYKISKKGQKFQPRNKIPKSERTSHQTSAKRWFTNRNMTSCCDVTNSVCPVTMTTIRHCSTPAFVKGAYNQAVAPGVTRALHATGKGAIEICLSEKRALAKKRLGNTALEHSYFHPRLRISF